MDGVNTLVIGYYLAISLAILYLANNFNLELNLHLTKTISVTLLILFIFNFFGKLFLGDSGAYLISFVLGYLLITFSNANQLVSPYFIVCLLWYPAYENLFSIIRKISNKNSPTKPDNKHLHQVLFIFIKSKLTYSDNISNTLTGLIINLVNWLIFLYATLNFNNSKQLLILILTSIVFYNFLYFFLLKKINHKTC
jgi:UDP-N-acetylmuramyl pentapeptide phosphotransferase/UDP-N-acetylglucosamine-1-phosphate transferase